MASLCQIAAQYRTDKCPAMGRHLYTPFYSAILHGREVKKLLELGIGYPEDMQHVSGYLVGASLRMWEEWFPDARIVGLDLNPKATISTPRIVCACVDERGENLYPVAKAFGPEYDVIIDDGSHLAEDQARAAHVLLPLLAPGGIYFIEDVNDPDCLRSLLMVDCDIVDFRLSPDDRIAVIHG